MIVHESLFHFVDVDLLHDKSRVSVDFPTIDRSPTILRDFCFPVIDFKDCSISRYWHPISIAKALVSTLFAS